MTSKAAYRKPTLIEYGSLAERTKIFGLLKPGYACEAKNLGLRVSMVTGAGWVSLNKPEIARERILV